MTRMILGVEIKYVTCPNVLRDVTIRHDKNGHSERFMVVEYHVMDVNNRWYDAIGAFTASDFPDRVWQETDWLSIEPIEKEKT